MIGEYNPGVITVPVTGFSVVINGIRKTFNMNDEGGDTEAWWAANFPDLLFSGPVGETLTNSSTQHPMRLAYRMEPANQDAVLSVAFTDNPTGRSSLDNGGWATVCFAPAEQNQISCAGATDYMGFQRLDGDWDTHVDGVFYPSPYDPAATIREHFSDIIDAQNDGFADFWNIDNTAPHRIMFVPRNTEGNPNSYILRGDNTNQSFGELPDGSLVFCLTAKPCEPTSMPLSLPADPFASPATGKHYLTWIETINGVSRTVTSSVDYPLNGQTWTYFHHLTSALMAEYVKPGNPYNGGTETEMLGLFNVVDQGDYTYTFEGLNAERGSKPMTIRVIQTPANVLGSSIDCYQFFINPDDGSAPEPVHSCGWDVIGYKVNNLT